jgi:ATPase subunit of ABC transporter with duplicated ATPase domains
MKLLTGEQRSQRGSVTRPPNVGVLRQDHYAFDKLRVIETAMHARVAL